MALQIRRGPNAQRATILLQTGEISWTTDTKKLYVGDGVTAGGVNILANIAGTGFVWNTSTEQLDLAGSTITGITADNVAETNGITPRVWYRSSLGKTHASEIFTTSAGAAHTGISFSWDDVNQKLTATVLTENAADAAAALFANGTHVGISFDYGLTQDAANRIDATVSAEYIQDTVAALIAAGSHTGIVFTYDDTLNALSAAVDTASAEFVQDTVASFLTSGTRTGITYTYDDATNTIATTVNFPTRGGNLDSNLVLNNNNITGSGNINLTAGNISTTGNITAVGAVTANNLSLINTVIPLLTGGLAVTYSGTTITVTTNVAHGLSSSAQITLTGITGTTNPPNTNQSLTPSGTNPAWFVISVTGPTTFTFTQAQAPTGVLNSTSGVLNARPALSSTGPASFNGNLSANTITTGTVAATTITTGTVAATATISAATYQSSDLVSEIVFQGGNNNVLNVVALTDGSSNTPSISLKASRGTLAVPVNNNPGDVVGGYTIKGYGNSAYKLAGSFTAQWAAAADLTQSLPGANLLMIAGANGSTYSVATFYGITGVFNSPLLATATYSATGTVIPSASTSGTGARAFVLDATVATFGSTYASGGTNKVPVYSDGTNWKIG